MKKTIVYTWRNLAKLIPELNDYSEKNVTDENIEIVYSLIFDFAEDNDLHFIALNFIPHYGTFIVFRNIKN